MNPQQAVQVIESVLEDYKCTGPERDKVRQALGTVVGLVNEAIAARQQAIGTPEQAPKDEPQPPTDAAAPNAEKSADAPSEGNTSTE